MTFGMYQKCNGSFITIPYLIFMFNYHVSQSEKKKNFAGMTFFHFWDITADFAFLFWRNNLISFHTGRFDSNYSPNFQICGKVWRLWAEIEAHKWRDLELNLSKTATKAIEFWSVGTSWSVRNEHFALFITD